MRRAVPSEPSTKCWRNPNPLLRSTFEDTNKWQHPKTSNNSDDVIVLMWTWVFTCDFKKEFNALLAMQFDLKTWFVHSALTNPLNPFDSFHEVFFWGYRWTQQSTAPSPIRIYSIIMFMGKTILAHFVVRWYSKNTCECRGCDPCNVDYLQYLCVHRLPAAQACFLTTTPKSLCRNLICYVFRSTSFWP